MAYKGIQRAVQKQSRWAAPVGGLNFASSVMATPPVDAYVLNNFFVRPFGVEIRKGWRYWLDTQPTGDPPPQPQDKPLPLPHGVGTLMAYTAPNAANNKLFAFTEAPAGAAFDVTTAGVTPLVPIAGLPTTPPNVPGEWYYVMYLTPGGSFMCAVSAGAGYYVYNGTTWAQYTNGGGPLQISFPAGDTTTTKQFSNIFVWKNRLWFFKENSSKAYYLPTNQISGAVNAFDFGALMPHGGNLEIGVNWTYDGGQGIDDFLVVMGSNGDMLIYEGTDPAQVTTFKIRGIWYVGRLPVGRRGWCTHGGDIVFLSEYGVNVVSDYVSGKLTTPAGQSSIGAKINPLLAREITSFINTRWWFITPFAKEEQLILGGPAVTVDTGAERSYTMSSLMGSWATMTNMKMRCGAIFNGEFYFGLKDGNVCQGFFGANDGSSVDGLIVGAEVTAQLQTAYLDFGSPTANKTITRIKVLGLSGATPAYFITTRPEYSFNDVLNVPAAVFQPGSLWDIALWDVGVWQSGRRSFGRWYGVAGFGKKQSILMAIRAQGGTTITDFEATYKVGNGL